MKANKFTFSVHTYAPELNKVYYFGKDISNKLKDDLRKSLKKDFAYNVRLIRKESIFKQAIFKHFVEIKYDIPNARYGHGIYSGYYVQHSDISEFLKERDKYHNSASRTVRLYSKKIKITMKNNSAYMRNKAELQKHDPNYKPPKGKFYRSRFNEFMMEFNKIKDKRGGSFETLQAKKARIIDKEEYDTLTDAHKNPQHGHKPTNKLSKENREVINRRLSNNKENDSRLPTFFSSQTFRWETGTYW